MSLPQQMFALANPTTSQPLLQQNNIITNHRHQEIQGRAPMSTSFRRKHEEIPRPPKFGHRSSGKYAFTDFLESSEIDILAKKLEAKDFEDHLEYMHEKMNCKRMSEWITFIAEDVLALEEWIRFKAVLEDAMEKTCKFYYIKVRDHCSDK